MRKFIFIFLIGATHLVWAHNTDGKIARKVLISEALPNVPAHHITSVEVVLPPGAEAGPHQHDAFVYAYVLEGKVESQLDGGELGEFRIGDSWIEPPGVIHTLTRNPSQTQKARFLVVFIAESEARLTTSADMH